MLFAGGVFYLFCVCVLKKVSVFAMFSSRIALWSYDSIQRMYVGRIAERCVFCSKFISCEGNGSKKIANQTFV